MTDDGPGLFAEMDEVAERISRQPDFIPEDLQIHFRQLQRVYQPELTEKEWLELYQVWFSGYIGKLEQRRENAQRNSMAIADEAARINGPGKPFKCVCGAETRDPMNVEWMAEHQPHIEEAGRQRITAERAVGILPPERTVRLDANGRPISL